MSLNISRTTQPLRFDIGIGSAGFADVIDSPSEGKPQSTLLPGSTTVSLALDEIFPTGIKVSAEIMRALVAENSAYLRTSGGFAETARSALHTLREMKSPAADAAAADLENLLIDTDLLERYRLALLET